MAALLLAFGAYLAASTWSDLSRVTIERPSAPIAEAAADEPDPPTPPEDQEDTPADAVTVPPSEDGLDVFLLVGSDSRAELDDLSQFGAFGGARADVIMLLIRPRDGSSAAILSLPRDLLVQGPCQGGETRINAALAGCGEEINGPTALMLTVENLTGVGIDHFALVDLAGFIDAVDAIGGYEICVETAVRDRRALLELPAGCTLADGEQALAWLRSRHTQELTDTGWQTMTGVSDLTRNQRQRDFLVTMMGKLSDFSSPQDIASVARQVAPYVTVDSGLSFLDAVGLAWTMRGLGSGSIVELDVPVVFSTTPEGETVLKATVDVTDVVAGYLHPGTAEGPPSFSS